MSTEPNGSCCTLDIETFQATKAHIAEHADDARGSFRTVTEWRDGAQAITRARSFTIQTDEPAPLGGKDQHFDPMELLLASLGACLTIGWVTHARLRGVDFRSLRITVHAPFDLRGYLGLDPSVRPGFTELDYTAVVDSDADAATLDEIRRAAEAGSPLFDHIARPTPISGKVERVVTSPAQAA